MQMTASYNYIFIIISDTDFFKWIQENGIIDELER